MGRLLILLMTDENRVITMKLFLDDANGMGLLGALD